MLIGVRFPIDTVILFSYNRKVERRCLSVCLSVRPSVRPSVSQPSSHIVSVTTKLYIHGSMHRNSILIRSNKMQQYAVIYLLQNHSLNVSGVHRTHHQENIKL